MGGTYVRVLSGNELFEGGDVSVPLFKHNYSTMLTGRQQFFFLILFMLHLSAFFGGGGGGRGSLCV